MDYDAIVIGSGMSGGWAAKELCEKGLKTLVIERGRKIDHPNYPTANLAPWEFKHRGIITAKDQKEYPVQSVVYAFDESTRHYWVKDLEHPYRSTAKDSEFTWIRGYHEGGRSLMWGRQCYRWSAADFEANLKDGHGVDWPIRYEDLAPWYSYVEKFVGISGRKDGFAQIPDGEFLPPFELNCVEAHVKKSLAKIYPDRPMTVARVANLTVPHNGRGACQRRNLCNRGCPYGAYFSSQSATLPAAAKTGNFTLLTDTVAYRLIYDDKSNRVVGVRTIDAETGQENEFRSKIVFLCAATLGSTWLLLNSANAQFPDGLANGSGTLGRYLMDHQEGVGATAEFPAFDDRYFFGGKPNGGIYMPRFRNVKSQDADFVRGYGFRGGASRAASMRGASSPGIGIDFKNELKHPGSWRMLLIGFGEMLPDKRNQVSLNHSLLDKHGLPTLDIHCQYGENEKQMRKDIRTQAYEMLEAIGGQKTNTFDNQIRPGLANHEMGTARMGRDRKTSVLNKWNQSHDIPNLFITDGACMTSSSCVNPSVTYMALTARAVDYAVKELNRRNI